jgi:hypothetical protein
MRELAEAGQEERKTRDHLEIMKQAERELMTKKRAELREFASRQNGLS